MPSSLQEHAADNLRFIRDTMSRATAFTAVPGWGGAGMGVTAVVTAAVTGPPDGTGRWLGLWLADAVLAAAIGLVGFVWKARRAGVPLTGDATRRFALAFLPGLAAGAVLTVFAVRTGWQTRLPGCWLLLYGAAVTSGGALSIRTVPIMGGALMALGALAFAAPVVWGHYFMAAGFGIVQIAAGLVIVRRYGG